MTDQTAKVMGAMKNASEVIHSKNIPEEYLAYMLDILCRLFVKGS